MASNKAFNSLHVSCKLTYYVCSFAFITSLTLRRYLMFENFATLSSWEMVKRTMSMQKFFFYKINKNMQRKLRIKCFVRLRFWHHSRQIQNLVTSWLCENWSKHQKTLCKALFPWNHYNYAMKIRVSFWSQVSFKSSFKLLLFFVVVHEKYVLKLKH